VLPRLRGDALAGVERTDLARIRRAATLGSLSSRLLRLARLHALLDLIAEPVAYRRIGRRGTSSSPRNFRKHIRGVR
jgi:hypothetical protein